MQCPKCGSENSPNNRFCLQCGSPLETTCPSCGQTVAPGVRFCPNCGQPLGGASVSAAAVPEVPTATVTAAPAPPVYGTTQGGTAYGAAGPVAPTYGAPAPGAPYASPALPVTPPAYTPPVAPAAPPYGAPLPPPVPSYAPPAGDYAPSAYAPPAYAAAPAAQYKGVWPRFFAMLIDAILLGVPLSYLLGRFVVSSTIKVETYDIKSMLVPFVIIVAVYLAYAIVLEAGGGTLGKRLLGMRVVDAAGNRPGYGRSVGRNLLRVLDMLPLFYILGAVLVAKTAKKQRLGDKVAGTYVVRRQRSR